MGSIRGLGLLEALAALAILGLSVGVAVPALASMRSSARMGAAARQFALGFQALRWRAVAEGRGHGLLFLRDAAGWYWLEVADGNGNGLRTSEVQSGTDATLSGPQRLEHRVSPVHPGIPLGGPFPDIPPGRGLLRAGDDPIRFGSSDLVAFSPVGSSSTGTIYITDATGLYAVVLYGRTARVRVWRYDAGGRRWTL